jgi:hypothetical protein
MAIRTAWWMRRDQLSRSRSLSSTSSNSRQPRRPYHGWPGNLPGLGLALNVLEQALNNGQGGACDIDKLYFGCEATPAEKPLWRHCGHIAVANELEVMVTEQVQDFGILEWSENFAPFCLLTSSGQTIRTTHYSKDRIDM